MVKVVTFYDILVHRSLHTTGAAKRIISFGFIRAIVSSSCFVTMVWISGAKKTLKLVVVVMHVQGTHWAVTLWERAGWEL